MKQDEAELGQTAVMERDGAATSSVARSQTQRERCAEAARNRGPKTDSGFISLSERFKELRQRLIDKGYDPDEPPPPPVYICSHCHDLGFVYPVDANGNTDYSRVKPCPSALCTRARLDSFQLNTDAAQARGIRATDQTFKTYERRQGTGKACQYARHLADGTSPFIWLLIYGGPGNGKSHLCNAMAKLALERHVDARVVPVAELFNTLRAAIDANQSEAVMRQYKDTWFLILDDYGVQYGSDWEGARFDELMTYRYANYLPTAMTTNLDITDLPDRIRSRFQDMDLSRIVHNSATDYRPTPRAITGPTASQGQFPDVP